MIAVAANDPRSRRSLSTVTSNSARPADGCAEYREIVRIAACLAAAHGMVRLVRQRASSPSECLRGSEALRSELHPELTRDFVEDVPRKDKVVVLRQYFLGRLGAGAGRGSRSAAISTDEVERRNSHAISRRRRKTSSSVVTPRAWARPTQFSTGRGSPLTSEVSAAVPRARGRSSRRLARTAMLRVRGRARRTPRYADRGARAVPGGGAGHEQSPRVPTRSGSDGRRLARVTGCIPIPH